MSDASANGAGAMSRWNMGMSQLHFGRRSVGHPRHFAEKSSKSAGTRREAPLRRTWPPAPGAPGRADALADVCPDGLRDGEVTRRPTWTLQGFGASADLSLRRARALAFAALPALELR